MFIGINEMPGIVTQDLTFSLIITNADPSNTEGSAAQIATNAELTIADMDGMLKTI